MLVLNVEKRHEYQASGNRSPNPGPRLSAHRDLSFTFLFKIIIIIKSSFGSCRLFIHVEAVITHELQDS